MKQKKKWIIITTIVIILLLAGIAVLGVKSGWFLSPKYKVLQAAANTWKESELAANVDITELLTEGEKTLQGELKLDGIGEVEVSGVLQEEELKVQIPTLGSLVFVYPYEEEKTGFLLSTVGEDKLKKVDEVLHFLYDPSEILQTETDAWANLKEEWDSLEFVRYEGEELITSDGMVCEAYETGISKEKLQDFSWLPELTAEEEVQVICYLAEQKLVALEIRQQEELLWKIDIAMSEEKETITISDEKQTLYELSYQCENGNIKLQSGNYKDDSKKNRFRIQISGTEVTIDLRNMNLLDWKLSGTITMEPSTSDDTLEGTEIKLSGMEQEDWNQLVEDIKQTLLEKILFFLGD